MLLAGANSIRQSLTETKDAGKHQAGEHHHSSGT
jgi:hypothetical protein